MKCFIVRYIEREIHLGLFIMIQTLMPSHIHNLTRRINVTSNVFFFVMHHYEAVKLYVRGI